MTRVKICGITNLADALAAIEYGADALGFVFAPGPRQASTSVVTNIVRRMPPFVCKVGVFVNSDLARVRETMSVCGLDLAQLHGQEDAGYCAALSGKAIKVFTVESLPSSRALARYAVAAYMLDRDKAPASAGLDAAELWKLARETGRQGPVVLAGGLTPENVGEAIAVGHPYAVDVASGVEIAPGKKDHARMRAFIEAAKRGRTGGML